MTFFYSDAPEEKPESASPTPVSTADLAGLPPLRLPLPHRVLIVDDHPLMREALVLILKGHPDFVVVGEASTAREAIALEAARQPHIILLDINMPGAAGSAFDAVRYWRNLNRPKGLKVVMCSADAERSKVNAALQAGASGFITKAEHPQVYTDGLLLVGRGQLFLSAGIRLMLQQTGPLRDTGSLNKDETLVFGLLGLGCSIAEIARSLSLPPGRVEGHLQGLCAKLNLTALEDLRIEAVRLRADRLLSDAPQP